MGPVIMSPQVVIGAVGRVQKVPRFDKNNEVSFSNIFLIIHSNYIIYQ